MKVITCRLLSAALMLYFSIARLGETGSYIEAAGAAALFSIIWSLGLNSTHEHQQPEPPERRGPPPPPPRPPA